MPEERQPAPYAGYWVWYSLVRYEYKCPHCGHINIKYEQYARIICRKCGKPFVV